MKKRRNYVISYDIVDNRNRNRAAETLKDYGIRIQKSVFECRLELRGLKELMQKLAKIIDPKIDSIVVYPLCLCCFNERNSIGVTVFREEKDYLVI
jgi:CRISPR-associated protein Cas2